MAKRKNKKNNNFVSENKIEETLDKGIEQMETNGGMSEAAMEAEIAAQENPRPDYLDENGNPHWFDEEEDYDVGQIPLEVVDRTEMLYANSDKVAAREYKIRIDEGLFKELAPEQYSETSFSDDEIPAITYRQSTDSEVPDQFLISKFKRGDYDIPLIQTTVEIKDEELLKQIKFNVEDYEEERQRTESVFEYDGLTYIPVRSLTDEEKSLINNRTKKEIWKNPIIQKPKNGNNYYLNDFLQKSGNFNADMFYCIERGKFFMPVEIGIINLNEEEIVDKHFKNELDEFKSSEINKKIIKEHRPLNLNKENDVSLMQDIISVLEEGEVFSRENETLGDVRVKMGNEKNGGLIHIIKHRMDRMIEHYGMDYESAKKETAAIIFLSLKNVSEAPATKETNGRFAVYKNGIKTVIGKDKNGRYVVTGFDFDDTKQEAADAINAVNALYGYTPEFLEIYAQVGAAYASLNNIAQQSPVVNENSNDSLEQNSLEKAAEALKNIKFNQENYKEVIDVINKISEISGEKKIEVPKPEEIAKEENEKQKSNDQAQDRDNDEGGVIAKPQEPQKPMDGGGAAVEEEKPKSETAMFDPTAPIVYGKTVLPSFAVKTEKGLVSIENPIVTGFNKKSGTYVLESGGEKLELPKKTFETLLSDKKEREAVQALIAEGKTIVFADESRGIKGTEIPEFSLITQHGLKTYKGFVPQSRDEAAGTYTLSNGEETLVLKNKDFAEVTAAERWENKFDEHSPTWQKLVPSQYEDYFKLRDNTAANFTHNISVACREKANSPCDAMRAAKMIIDQMSKDEKAKTQALLNEMAREEKNLNMVIAGIYHEAVKCVPLNEEKIKQDFPDKYIARPMFDTISGDGQKVENDQALVKNGQDRNLRIGSVLKNIDVQSDALFGKGKNSVRFSELRVVSASKEGNSITLIDEKNSYIKLPRDTVLSLYKEQQLREMKSECKVERKNTMSISYS